MFYLPNTAIFYEKVVLQKSHITFNLETKDSSISISSLTIFIIDTNLSMIFSYKTKKSIISD